MTARDNVRELKERYVKGARVKLLEMPEERLASGSLGTVVGVDDLGTVHVSWDCGSNLGLIVGVDRFVLLG